MLREIIGPKGMVFNYIHKAPKDVNGYVQLSYQDITNHFDNLSFDTIRRALASLVRNKAIVVDNRGAPIKNRWRITPNALSTFDTLLQKKQSQKQDNQNDKI